MNLKVYQYNFYGYFFYNDNITNLQFDEVEEVRKKYPKAYRELRDLYIRYIISYIELCGCKFVTLDTLFAHKWDIREIFKKDKITADMMISKVFSFREEQRLSIISVSELLTYVMDGLCGISIDNHRLNLKIHGGAFQMTLELPIQLVPSTLTYESGEIGLDCEMIEIADDDELDN